MAVTTAAQSDIFGAASGVMLHGDTCPMVHGVGKPVMAGLSSHDDAAFARPLGDGRDAGQAAQGRVIAPLQGVPGLREQRGQDNSSHSRQRCEDLRVMLFHLSWLDFYRGQKVCGQNIELTMRVLELAIHKADALDKTRNMSGSRFNRSSGDLQRRLAQHAKHMRRVEAPER